MGILGRWKYCCKGSACTVDHKLTINELCDGLVKMANIIAGCADKRAVCKIQGGKCLILFGAGEGSLTCCVSGPHTSGKNWRESRVGMLNLGSLNSRVTS